MRQQKQKISPIQIARIIIQIASFFLIPGLFITIFSAVGEIYKSIIGGTFQIGEQGGNIALVAVVFGITFVWGRYFCGFVCSLGAMQDLFWLIGRKIPFKPVISGKADKALKFVKFGVLAFVVIAVWTFGVTGDAVWSPWTVFGMYASPWKGVPAQAVILSVGGILLLITMAGSLFIERFFCKYFCPLGALFTIVSYLRIFKIKREAGKCNGSCRLCTRKCSMSIPIHKYEKVDSGECINCMKCVTVCPRGSIKDSTVSVISGTTAAAAVAGASFIGTLPMAGCATVQQETTVATTAEETAEKGTFKDGTYTGTATGYRGETTVEVKVENGKISEINVVSTGDDKEFMDRVTQKIIPAIINSQDVNVDTVSGATFSSKAIINAVSDALGDQLLTAKAAAGTAKEKETETEETKETTTQITTEAATEATTQATTEATTEAVTEATTETTARPETEAVNSSGLTDGVYSGSGSGFRGNTKVSVTVSGGKITDIEVTSYQDDAPYFNRCEGSIIADILSSQSVDVDTVSGATFSSNSIIEAVANALDMEFTNPNSSMSRGRGH